MRCNCHSHNGLVRRSPEGLALRRDVSQADLAAQLSFGYLDKVGSVSGLRRDETHMIWNEELLDEQHRRYLQVVGEEA